MPFIGNKPSAVPLTAADIADGIITSAKIVDGTITNSDVASSIITGQTAETSIAGGDSVLIFDDSASALRKMTRTNFVAGIGGTNTPSFGAYMSASQTIANATATKVNFDTEFFDTDSAYNTTNKRFTVPSDKAGKYVIIGKVRMATGNDFEAFIVDIYKNGSIYSRGFARHFFYDTLEVVAIVDLVATDFIEIFVTQEAGGTEDLASSAFSGSQFFGFKLI